MATRNILTDGERGLEKKSRIVTDFNKRLHILLDDMQETLIEANGLGLAAPQVGVLRRAVLIVDTSIESEYIDDQIVELINPEIIQSYEEQIGNEGCLSIPGVYGIVNRPGKVLVKAQDRNGNFFEYEGSDIIARAVCHEIDHLEGILFTSIADRMLTDEEIAEMQAQSIEDESCEKEDDHTQ